MSKFPRRGRAGGQKQFFPDNDISRELTRDRRRGGLINAARGSALYEEYEAIGAQNTLPFPEWKKNRELFAMYVEYKKAHPYTPENPGLDWYAYTSSIEALSRKERAQLYRQKKFFPKL